MDGWVNYLENTVPYRPAIGSPPHSFPCNDLSLSSLSIDDDDDVMIMMMMARPL